MFHPIHSRLFSPLPSHHLLTPEFHLFQRTLDEWCYRSSGQIGEENPKCHYHERPNHVLQRTNCDVQSRIDCQSEHYRKKVTFSNCQRRAIIWQHACAILESNMAIVKRRCDHSKHACEHICVQVCLGTAVILREKLKFWRFTYRWTLTALLSQTQFLVPKIAPFQLSIICFKCCKTFF